MVHHLHIFQTEVPNAILMKLLECVFEKRNGALLALRLL